MFGYVLYIAMYFCRMGERLRRRDKGKENAKKVQFLNKHIKRMVIMLHSLLIHIYILDNEVQFCGS